MKNKGISVIIPNYNGSDLLAQTLPGVFTAVKNSGLPFEVIVSDDHSTDDSLVSIAAKFPDVILLSSEVNRGFSPTINKGIFAARYDLVMLLNSDVKLTEDYFKNLPEYFEDPATFGVMGRIVGWEDEHIQDAAKYPSFHGAKIKTTGNYLPLETQAGERLYSMYLSGANALVSREKLWQLGGFDEIYAPFYVEDYDLSLRAWRVGWVCYYAHDAICRHKVSVSIKSKNSKDYVNTIYYRNKMFLHAIHLQGSTLFAWYLQLLPETLIRLLTFRFYYLKSLSMFFAGRGKVKASQQRLAALGRPLLSVQEVMKLVRNSVGLRPVKKF